MVPSPTPHQPINGLAIAGFVCGIIGIITSWIFVGLPFSITDLVLSAMGMRSNRGKEIAIAGLVLSILGILFINETGSSAVSSVFNGRASISMHNTAKD